MPETSNELDQKKTAPLSPTTLAAPTNIPQNSTPPASGESSTNTSQLTEEVPNHQRILPELPKDLFQLDGFSTKLRVRILIGLLISHLVIIAISSYLLIFGIVAKTILALIVVGFGGIAIILSALIVWFFLKPLEKIYHHIKDFESGKNTQPINLDSADELGMIAQAINQLTSSVQTNMQKLSHDKALTNSEKDKLAAILSALKDGLVVLSPQKTVLLANQEAEKIIGQSFGEMIGQPIDELLNLTDRAGLAISSVNFCPVDSKNTPLNYETPQPVKLLNKAAAEFVLNITTTPITGSKDSAYLLMLRDMGKQKQLDSMQLDFVSMASHELRTPLTTIKGYLSVFLNENSKSLNKEQKEFLERIASSAQQLETLINNLLAVSKVERGAIAIDTQPVDWNTLVTQVVQDNQIQASAKNIELTLKKLGTIPTVNADRVRVTEVLNNLLGNAVNYTQEGGKIVVTVSGDSKEVTTSVQDNGRGISPSDLASLFTKFFRVQGALDQASNSKGTGLGLYLSKSIVEMHKGKIWAESAGLGKGTTFKFTLPIAEKTSIADKLAPLQTPTLKL